MLGPGNRTQEFKSHTLLLLHRGSYLISNLMSCGYQFAKMKLMILHIMKWKGYRKFY